MGIMSVIVLNMIQMAFAYEDASSSFNNFMDLMNYIFTTIFVLEAAVKIFVFGWSYFNMNWNKFDFFVVLTSIFDIVLS